MQMTADKIKLAYPDLHAEIHESGFKEGLDKGQVEAAKEAGPTPEEQAAMVEVKRLQALGPDGLEDERLKKMFTEDPQLQTEFRTFDAFRGFYRNRESVKIIGGTVVSQKGV